MNPPRESHILVVDDNRLNRMLLLRLLNDLGHRVTEAVDGVQALHILQGPAGATVDAVLLDILMPEMDGYGLLEAIKSDPKLRSIPVIMISALEELDSVVRCIEIGATDYLTKPIQRGLLKARLKSTLAEKRLRDLELEYLEQVGHVVSAAEAVETSQFDPASLKQVAARSDALGRLARVFEKMAREVHLREQRLKQQLAQLQLDIEEMQKALAEELQIYLPMDRRQSLVLEQPLPTRSTGAVLFADISDFTRLTAELSQELGRHRGAEEITRLINQIFATLVEETHAFRGSVISFSGDAITCWFDDLPQEHIDRGDPETNSGGVPGGFEGGEPIPPAGLRAIVAGLYMQTAMLQFEYLALRRDIRPGIKVAVISGPAQRLLVGDPSIQTIEILVGKTLEHVEAAGGLARRGEVLVDADTARHNQAMLEIREQRNDPQTGAVYAVLGNLKAPVDPTPWPDLPKNALSPEQCRPWIHPRVFRQAVSPNRQYLAELRPAAALFVHFEFLDLDADPEAAVLLDDYIRWVQQALHSEGGAVLQLTFGDKGSYLYAAFGAPISHPDDAARAVRAGLRILSAPARYEAIRKVKVGVSYGEMRAGSYGGDTHRTYGVIGSRTNLAARLMQAAAPGSLLCDETTVQAVQGAFAFEALPPMAVKGRAEPVEVFRAVYDPAGPDAGAGDALRIIGAFSPSEQLILKVSSAIGMVFRRELLEQIMPEVPDPAAFDADLRALAAGGVIIAGEAPGELQFCGENIRLAAYESMLYVQRRHLHRKLALLLEEDPIVDAPAFLASLADHWQAAEENTRAIEFLEKAGQLAQSQGDLQTAQSYFQRSLELAASESELSQDYAQSA